MINILPHTTRRALVLEQRMRLIAMVVATVAAALAILTALLVPIYISASDQLTASARYTDIEKESRALARQDNSLRTARIVSTQLDAATGATPRDIVNTIEDVMRIHTLFASTIMLTGFSYTTTGDDALIRIAGVAADTLVLSDFVDMLKRSGDFGGVALPISDLADDAGTFSITITLPQQ